MGFVLIAAGAPPRSVMSAVTQFLARMEPEDVHSQGSVAVEPKKEQEWRRGRRSNGKETGREHVGIRIYTRARAVVVVVVVGLAEGCKYWVRVRVSQDAARSVEDTHTKALGRERR